MSVSFNGDEIMNDIKKSLEVLRELDRVDELNPIANARRKKQDIKAKFGHQKSELEMGAREDADRIMANWKKTNIPPTVSNIIKWMEQNQIHTDVVRAGFKGIGMEDDELNKYIAPEDEVGGEEPGEEPGEEGGEEDTSQSEDIWKEWDAYKQEKGAPAAPTVRIVKDFIQSKDSGVPDDEIGKVLKQAGAKNTALHMGLSLSVAQQAISSLFGINPPTEEPTDDESSLTDKQEAKGETVGQASGQDVQDQWDAEGIPRDKQQQMFQDAGIDPNAPEIGDEGAEALGKLKAEVAPREEPTGGASNVVARFQEEIRGSTIQKATRLALQAKRDKGGDLTDLEKLGAAFILSALK